LAEILAIEITIKEARTAIEHGVASMTGTVLAYSDRRSASSLTAANGADRAEPWRVDR
jgi:hypothetical protein